jgi:hypothetical protein
MTYKTNKLGLELSGYVGPIWNARPKRSSKLRAVLYSSHVFTILLRTLESLASCSRRRWNSKTWHLKSCFLRKIKFPPNLSGHHSVREKIETRIKKKNIKFNLPSSLMQTASTIDPNKVQTIIMEDLDYPFIQFSLDLRDSSYHLDTSSKPTDNGGSCKSAPCKIHISRVPGSRSGWIHPSLTDPRRHVVQYGTHT